MDVSDIIEQDNAGFLQNFAQIPMDSKTKEENKNCSFSQETSQQLHF